MRRNLSLILALLMLAGSAVSCSSATENSDGEGEAAATENVTVDAEVVDETEPEEEYVKPDLPERDFGGETYTFYGRIYDGAWSAIDIITDGATGEQLNDAVFQRQTYLEETYNFKLAEIESDNVTIQSLVQTFVTAGDTSFQAVVSDIYDAAGLSTAGALRDLKNVDNIDLTQRWWSQEMNSSMTIANRQFYATGEIFVIDNKATRVVFLNKDLQNNLGLGNTYSKVLEGKWTYDEFFNMAEAATMDLDGDGTLDRAKDQFGCMSQPTLGGILYLGSGESFTKKDEDDIPYMACTSERAVTVMSKITEKLSATSSCSQSGDTTLGKENPDNVYYFMEGRALFAPEVLLHIETMRDCDVDIGILPAPKYDETQEKYWCYADGWCVNVVSIPATVSDTDGIGYVLEAMAADSLNNLTPAYYDICLTKKYVRDPESVQMLDLIFDGVVTDNANIFSWGNLESTINTALTNGSEIVSAVKKVEKVVTKVMEKTVSSIQSVEG